MTGHEKPPDQVEKTRMGGREVLIGLSRRDVMSLFLVRRRLQDYIKAGGLVTPQDLEGLVWLLDDGLPEEKIARWLLVEHAGRHGAHAGS